MTPLANLWHVSPLQSSEASPTKQTSQVATFAIHAGEEGEKKLTKQWRSDIIIHNRSKTLKQCFDCHAQTIP
ncbi:hypothetical protein, partial [Phormidium sp. CCY1219]|uniref:hypothetical protein n=1 Tax=Phormidium sp. CCY1219 TaxID=2886104 RepID=UPI002D1F1F0A